MEKVMGHPRLSPQGNMNHKRGRFAPKDVRMIQEILSEHNRPAGVFDYNYPQNFYSHNADIDQEAYLIVGARGSAYAHHQYPTGTIQSPESKQF